MAFPLLIEELKKKKKTSKADLESSLPQMLPLFQFSDLIGSAAAGLVDLGTTTPSHRCHYSAGVSSLNNLNILRYLPYMSRN